MWAGSYNIYMKKHLRTSTLTAVTSAPLASNTFTTSLWPFLQAAIRGVTPSYIHVMTEVSKNSLWHTVYHVNITVFKDTELNVYIHTYTLILNNIL